MELLKVPGHALAKVDTDPTGLEGNGCCVATDDDIIHLLPAAAVVDHGEAILARKHFNMYRPTRGVANRVPATGIVGSSSGVDQCAVSVAQLDGDAGRLEIINRVGWLVLGDLLAGAVVNQSHRRIAGFAIEEVTDATVGIRCADRVPAASVVGRAVGSGDRLSRAIFQPGNDRALDQVVAAGDRDADLAAAGVWQVEDVGAGKELARIGDSMVTVVVPVGSFTEEQA